MIQTVLKYSPINLNFAAGDVSDHDLRRPSVENDGEAIGSRLPLSIKKPGISSAVVGLGLTALALSRLKPVNAQILGPGGAVPPIISDVLTTELSLFVNNIELGCPNVCFLSELEQEGYCTALAAAAGILANKKVPGSDGLAAAAAGYACKVLVAKMRSSCAAVGCS